MSKYIVTVKVVVEDSPALGKLRVPDLHPSLRKRGGWRCLSDDGDTMTVVADEVTDAEAKVVTDNGGKAEVVAAEGVKP